MSTVIATIENYNELGSLIFKNSPTEEQIREEFISSLYDLVNDPDFRENIPEQVALYLPTFEEGTVHQRRINAHNTYLDSLRDGLVNMCCYRYGMPPQQDASIEIQYMVDRMMTGLFTGLRMFENLNIHSAFGGWDEE